jgi:hypothetical protein
MKLPVRMRAHKAGCTKVSCVKLVLPGRGRRRRIASDAGCGTNHSTLSEPCNAATLAALSLPDHGGQTKKRMT